MNPKLLRMSLLSFCFVASCGPSARTTFDSPPGTPDAPPGNTIDGSDLTQSRVYAHTGDHLYRFDTDTNQPIDVGAITGLTAGESITDIAVDKTEKIIGISFKRLYTINKDTGAATVLKDLPAAVSSKGFTSLSFVPADINNMNSPERLIAATNGGDVFEISPTTGEASPVGSYGMEGGKPKGSSGDIVAIYGAGIFATVDIGTSDTDRAKPDYLAKLNPVTFEAILKPTDTGTDRIFGLAYWKGKVYGFVDVKGVGAARTGKFVEINQTTGAATMLTDGPMAWFGAGVTTIAPIVE
jgi:hypothetical protein